MRWHINLENSRFKLESKVLALLGGGDLPLFPPFRALFCKFVSALIMSRLTDG